MARFGASTTTQDASGEVIEKRPADIDRSDVEREAKAFVGDIEQMPPMVSAVKVGGERLYEKARRGEEVERPARPVTIYELHVTGFTEGDTPEAVLDVACSAGTFVRTLIHDLGEALGCGAHMSGLRRTEAGGFGESDLVPLDEVTEDSLRPLIDAVRVLHRIDLDEQQAVAVSHGRPLEDVATAGNDPVALVRAGELVAVYKPKNGKLVADRVVPA